MNDKLEIEGDKRDDVNEVDKLEGEFQNQFIFIDLVNELVNESLTKKENAPNNEEDSKDFF